MVLWGTIVNAAAIVAGGLLGLLLPEPRQGLRTVVMQGIGLALCVLGIGMAIKSEHMLLLISSLVAGGIIGEWLGLERRLEALGQRIEARFGGGSTGRGSVAAGFVTTTLIYCVGAMAILGAISSGLEHEHDILYTKAMLDGFLSILFASTLGYGVLLSAVSVFVYQGAIAVAASLLAAKIGGPVLDEVIREVSAVGGVLIIGIGIDILGLKRILVGNLLPAIAVAAAAAPFL